MRRGSLLPGLVLALLLANVAWYLWPRLQAPAPPVEPEPGVASLVLLSELPEPPPPALSMRDLQPIRLASRCWWLGPLPAGANATVASSALPSGARVEGRPTIDGTEHWVYVAPGESSQPLAALQQQADEMGVDSYIVEEGDLAGYLSFGYFREGTVAGSIFRDRQAQGFPVQLLSRPRVRERDWLLLTPPLRASMNWAVLDQPPPDWRDLSLDPTPCPLEAIAAGPPIE